MLEEGNVANGRYSFHQIIHFITSSNDNNKNNSDTEISNGGGSIWNAEFCVKLQCGVNC